MTSPPQPDSPDAVGAAGQLADALNGMSDRLDAVRRYGRRSRLYILFDVAITILLAFGGFELAHTSQRADSATASAAAATAAERTLHAAQLSGCQVGNQERAGQLALWTYLFDASKPTSKAQAEAVDKFMGIVRATFAQRDCATAYPLPKGDPGGGG